MKNDLIESNLEDIFSAMIAKVNSDPIDKDLFDRIEVDMTHKTVTISNLKIDGNTVRTIEYYSTSIPIHKDIDVIVIKSCFFDDRIQILGDEATEPKKLKIVNCVIQDHLIFDGTEYFIDVVCCNENRAIDDCGFITFSGVQGDVFIDRTNLSGLDINNEILSNILIAGDILNTETSPTSEIKHIIVSSRSTGEFFPEIQISSIKSSLTVKTMQALSIYSISNDFNTVFIKSPKVEVEFENSGIVPNKVRRITLARFNSFYMYGTEGIERFTLSRKRKEDFLFLSSLKFKKTNKSSYPSLNFSHSDLDNTYLKNINLSQVKKEIDTCEVRNTNIADIEWGDIKSITPSRENRPTTVWARFDIYLQLKIAYLKMGDRVKASQFYKHELIELYRNGDSFDKVVSGFNLFTGHGSNGVKPLLCVLFLTLVFSSLEFCTSSKFESLGEVYTLAIFPFKNISSLSHKGIYILTSSLNSALIYQAVISFRKFNRRF